MCKMLSWEKIFGSEHMLVLHGILLESKYLVNQWACL
jgi:hypothetical protein